jgi:hypothetical protein
VLHTGRCFCGAVTLSITADPVGARLCWCRACQKIACGSPAVNVLFDPATVTVTGPVSRIERVAQSGNRIERGFCPACGTQVYARTIVGPPVPMRVRAGVLDDPELCPPSIVVWASSAPSWGVFPDHLPVHAEGPGSALWRAAPESAQSKL